MLQLCLHKNIRNGIMNYAKGTSTLLRYQTLKVYASNMKQHSTSAKYNTVVLKIGFLYYDDNSLTYKILDLGTT